MKIDKFNHTIIFEYSSGSSPPDFKGMTTSDIAVWVKFDDYEWFRPFGNFSKVQVIEMINICNNEHQLISLMRLLSAKEEEL